MAWTTSAARARCSMKLNDEGETKPGGLGSTLMTTGLEGFAPTRRPHHKNEHAAVVMPRRHSSEVVLRQGGLGVMKIYVYGIISTEDPLRLSTPAHSIYLMDVPCLPTHRKAARASSAPHRCRWHPLFCPAGRNSHTCPRPPQSKYQLADASISTVCRHAVTCPHGIRLSTTCHGPVVRVLGRMCSAVLLHDHVHIDGGPGRGQDQGMPAFMQAGGWPSPYPGHCS
mmetsp:Transcript_2252/g.4630  ORF Transcript_2252/g.4630 Transcript_2252/m.4630 type:complete len:226 (-) Transcript_2252:201-878(-)